ncbi:uncharacterized protein F5147DRAFT_49321 [Suillus discolor]|uniref:Uncharacterized protein n=1 Tax=Suillus discolor TaxID=1912936 RepID=A0A9P7FDR8_9AGAM|nr:uncharacterized protein F5147DRAFT_49321 [Suillus discolor]KAG2113533.1 hypothetical protein F5147DRAFT_49321 [Suillus discolor]
MLSKYFALFAAFATFTPAFAAPVPETLVDVLASVTNVGNDATVNVLTKRADAVNPGRKHAPLSRLTRYADQNGISVFDELIKRLEFTERDSGCDVADVDVIVSNVLNNVTINILKRTEGCDIVGVTAAATDILNNLKVNILTKREVTDEEVNNAVANAVQSQGITLAHRSNLDDATAVNDILKRYQGVAARGKESDFTQAQIVSAINQALAQSSGSGSRRRDTSTSDVQNLANKVVGSLYGHPQGVDTVGGL